MRLSRSSPIEKPLSDRMLCFKVDPFIVEGTDLPPLRRRISSFFLSPAFFHFSAYAAVYTPVTSSALRTRREFHLLEET